MNPDDVIHQAEGIVTEAELTSFMKNAGEILGRLVVAIDDRPDSRDTVICATALFIDHILCSEDDGVRSPEIKPSDERLGKALVTAWTPSLLRAITRSIFFAALPDVISRYSLEEQQRFIETIREEALKHLEGGDEDQA